MTRIYWKGPAKWSKFAQCADGKNQSPIDIKSETAVFDQTLLNRPLQIEYKTDAFKVLKNSGHSFQINGNSSNSSLLQSNLILTISE